MGYNGKTVLISGGARGIGEAVARHFAATGAKIVVLDVARDLGEKLVADLGPAHRFVALDVTDPQAWRDLAATLDGVDLAFLNAGVMSRPSGTPIFDDPLAWIGPETYRRISDINIGGVVNGISALLPVMRGREGATFLINSSITGVAPFPMDPFYAMTKHALVGLACSLAPALAEQGLRIVTILPRGIETLLTPPDLHRKIAAEGRFAPPSVMAEAIEDILDRAANGELWVGGGHTESHLYVPAPLRLNKT